jgi:hypothetical protein
MFEPTTREKRPSALRSPLSIRPQTRQRRQDQQRQMLPVLGDGHACRPASAIQPQVCRDCCARPHAQTCIGPSGAHARRGMLSKVHTSFDVPSGPRGASTEPRAQARHTTDDCSPSRSAVDVRTQRRRLDCADRRRRRALRHERECRDTEAWRFPSRERTRRSKRWLVRRPVVSAPVEDSPSSAG